MTDFDIVNVPVVSRATIFTSDVVNISQLMRFARASSHV